MTKFGRGTTTDGRPMPTPDDAEMKSIAHALCVEHVKVAGLRRPVCIAKGVNREAAIAEARELARVG